MACSRGASNLGQKLWAQPWDTRYPGCEGSGLLSHGQRPVSHNCICALAQSLAQARQEMLVEPFHLSSLTITYTGSPGHTVVANAIRRPRGNGLCSAVQTVLNIDSQLSLPCFLHPLCRRGCFQPLAMLICFSLSPGFQKERVTRVKCAPHPTSL